jgi:hypothetical protein
MNRLPSWRQRGVALPVMLIILLVMLVSSIYLLKASNSTTLITSNLAYDASLSRAADLGLHTGFQWLSAKAASDKAALDKDDSDNAYLALHDTTQTPRDDAFWIGAKTIVNGGNKIEYVVHRLCALAGRYDNPKNSCIQTAANPAALGTAVAMGESLASDAPSYAGSPQLHYVITSRIRGPRGGNVINQMVVLVGA